jgi:hypothetical protein
MKKILAVIALCIISAPASAWEIISQRNDGIIFTIAEQMGDGGAMLTIVCFNKNTHLEVVIPARVDLDEAPLIFQVDSKPEVLVAGFWEKIDRDTSQFIGIDRSDNPSVQTQSILKQISRGKSLYLGDPDVGEAVERFDLSGSRQAINSVRANCQ